MSAISRVDRSIVGHWWWTVDRWTLLCILALVLFGALMTLAASPGVADRIGLDSFHFVRRQLAYLPFAVALMIAVSLLSPLWVRRVACLVFLGALTLTALTLVIGAEVKGAQRWIWLGGFTLQPSEFLKPAFAVVAAWMFAEQRRDGGLPGNAICMALFAVVLSLLLLQPDVGMALVISVVWFGQFFIAGLPLIWVVGLAIMGIGLAVGAYAFYPHVTSRVDRFLDPTGGDNYQIDRAMEAFHAGGLFGRGPGEGAVKAVLPDAHTDFIFAVVAEEYGLFICLLVVAIFAFIVLRGFLRLLECKNFFVMLASVGLLTQFGLQAIINIGVNLRLMPAKGMTLPFISYGGSSLLALAFCMGMVLAFGRRRPGLGAEL
ncbi:putative lipid II flippase FtsW [Oceanibacterium hippocampi]|uniref:Probable peptidoglycan glycosyltransferase FtsW n=1 Tax=Oceanibacterium hippocampi TaxID=745714 RepID=A0A1Y5SG92_9PROT|nr:putative lipid II flippase FtsW [Oceanibacterium hippocampi]SLN37300.1 Lipid II flippase FtsW [Oceanibacterium hippocampi]